MALNELDIFAAAIRRSESGSFGGSYGITKPGTTGGQTLGAYQISELNWPDWAGRAGLIDADWRNRSAQDAVAKNRMTELYNTYGDWRLVALSWFFGGDTAIRVAQTGLEGSGFEREITQLEQNMRDAKARNFAPESDDRLSIEDPLTPRPPADDDFDFGPVPTAARTQEEPGQVRQTALTAAQARQQQDEPAPGEEARAVHDTRSQMARTVGAVLQGLSNAIKRGANAAPPPLPEGDFVGDEDATAVPGGAVGDEIVPGGVG